MSTEVATRKASPPARATGSGLAVAHGAGVRLNTVAEMKEMATLMAGANVALPKHLRNDVGMCFAVLYQAVQWEMDPFAVARQSYAVNDQLAYSAQLMTALVNRAMEKPLKYKWEGEGDKMTCTVTGRDAGGEEVSLTSPPIGQISPKNSPLWKVDPKRQLGYWQGRAWTRLFRPDVLLGVATDDEVLDLKAEPREERAPRAPSTADLTARLQNKAAVKAETIGYDEKMVAGDLGDVGGVEDVDFEEEPAAPTEEPAQAQTEPDAQSSTPEPEAPPAAQDEPATPDPFDITDDEMDGDGEPESAADALSAFTAVIFEARSLETLKSITDRMKPRLEAAGVDLIEAGRLYRQRRKEIREALAQEAGQ